MRTLAVVPRPPIPVGLAIPPDAVAQAGAFTRSQARRAGWSDARQRTLLRNGVWVPVVGSVVRHRDAPDGPWMRAWAVHLTGGLIPCHATAGRLWGLVVGEDLHGSARRPIEPRGIHIHRSELPGSDLVAVGGLVVTSPLRTVADLLRGLPVADSIRLATAAMRDSLLDPADLSEAARSCRGRTGAGRARMVARTCAGRPFSPLEWRFHQLLARSGQGWTFNVLLTIGGASMVVDALHVPSGTVVELDGRAFHGDDRFQADRTRDQRLLAAGHVVIRFTWEDVERRPEDVLDTIRRVLARRLPVPGSTPPHPPHPTHPGRQDPIEFRSLRPQQNRRDSVSRSREQTRIPAPGAPGARSAGL